CMFSFRPHHRRSRRVRWIVAYVAVLLRTLQSNIVEYTDPFPNHSLPRVLGLVPSVDVEGSVAVNADQQFLNVSDCASAAAGRPNPQRRFLELVVDCHSIAELLLDHLTSFFVVRE